MPSEVHIRIGEMRDVDAIAELNIAMAWETEQRRLDPSTIRRGIRAVMEDSDHGFYVMAERAGEVIGCLLITFEWSDWRSARFWWIQSLYVRPAHRRHGVFTHLYDFVKERAMEQPDVCGLRLYVEQSNHVAQRAYDQIGMVLTRYRMYEAALQCTPRAAVSKSEAPHRTSREINPKHTPTAARSTRNPKSK